MDNEAPGALESTVGKLVILRERLKEMHGASHRFHRIFGSQEDAAYERIKLGANLSDSTMVAALFGNSQHVRQFQVLIFVTSVVIRGLIDAIKNAHDRKDLPTLLGLLRSLIERFAHLHYLLKSVAKKLSAKDDTASHPFIASINIEADVKNALYGTTVKWNDVAQKTLEEVDVKVDLGRQLKNELGAYFSTQVLNKIDTLNADRPGTRAAYEILCDFLHPNTGDLFASTTSYSESVDRFGVHHIVRLIEIDKKIEVRHTADRVVLEKVFALIVDLSSICADDFVACAKVDEALSEHLRSYTREILKKYRKTFMKNDLCPCSSGQLVFRCCGRGVMMIGK